VNGVVVDLFKEEEEETGIASDKSGSNFVQLIVRIRWNPVYKALLRIRSYENEQIGQ